MNTLFLSLLYPPKRVEEIAGASKDGMQNQINSYQWAFVEGIRQNLEAGETLDILNALPVGAFPRAYRKLCLPSLREGNYVELGSLNLPGLKQFSRRRKAAREIRRWAEADPNHRQVLLYSLYLPYMQAVAKVKRQIPDLKAAVIITDLPNELGISSGRRGFLKQLEYAMGDRRVELCKVFDGFVLLTEQMAEVLPIQGKPQMVLEGLILPQPAPKTLTKEAKQAAPLRLHGDSPAVLYTGTLNAELGIGELLEAFEGLPDYELWLCGKGDLEAKVREACGKCKNIHYFGFVSHEDALALQEQADILINPRSQKGRFTRYSFPSKTLEYMRSGRPVLCYPLEGIPADYTPYLVYIRQEGSLGIQQAVRELLEGPKKKRLELGLQAQNYALTEKSAKRQCERLVQFLRSFSA